MELNRSPDMPEQALSQRFDVLCELGDCYASVSNFSQAQQHYEAAANLDPDAAQPYVGLGVIALQQSRLDDAEIAFKVARRLDNRAARAFCGLAMVSQQKKQYAEALEFYLKCLEIDSDNLTALLGLFQASCEMRSFAKVIHYLELYLDSHPADTAVMFCLATLYVKESRYSEARRLLSDVLLFSPENSDAANLLEEVEHKIRASSRQEINA